ncbi:MAG TPA: polynucleotide adenylyltransferase PcnB, partial [Gammaproteobacteria bacterium]|nr:polynucleotide adenylyltransferase PcnB [Gammaproteobacteria bacterium]
LAHPRFRAAYDFLMLRAEAGEVDAELAGWWTRVQSAGTDAERELLAPAAGATVGRRRRSRRRRRHKVSAPA